MKSLPLYQMYDMTQAALAPWRFAATMQAEILKHPANPFAQLPGTKATVAALDLFERCTRVYAKPEFAITDTRIGGRKIRVVEEVVRETPFCRVLRFRRDVASSTPDGAGKAASVAQLTKAVAQQPKVLLVAPMSGHYATLLRGTVEEMSRYADVYITDWKSASTVPLTSGDFDLTSYVQHVRDTLTHIGPGAHVMAVCQPSVPVMAAVALMNEDNDPATPRTMTLMGGPIDTRINPQEPNHLAMKHPLSWFKDNIVQTVPFGHAGAGRDVCPGFMQQLGFVSMNWQRHVDAHGKYYSALLQGADEAVRQHREFYDEYNAVMDLPGAYYLETIDAVFQRHLLPKGELMIGGRRVDLTKITRTALMTVEGQRDDITGIGQTRAAHDLMPGLDDGAKVHHEEPGVGHYGIFNGKHWKANIAPAVAAFQTRHNG